MPTDTRDARADAAAVFLTWDMPLADAPENLYAKAAWWVGGGASLLAWTALALLLTA